MNRCNYAIIAVGGYGTRRLPITKVIDKCMLPILNRPIVDYVVADCIRAGITNIYIVDREKGDHRVRGYYSHDVELEEYLRRNGKEAELILIQPPTGVSFHFVEQDVDGAYGTAVPVALCRDLIPKGESAVVCMGDDCLYYPDETSSDIRSLIEASGTGAGMIGVEVPHDEVSQYGVLESDDQRHFVRIVEKPKIEDAPSNLINVSKYLFTSELLDETLAYVDQANPQGEYLITDPINSYVAAGNMLKVVPAGGQYLDAGTLEGWLKANQVVASHEII